MVTYEQIYTRNHSEFQDQISGINCQFQCIHLFKENYKTHIVNI
jgi:hypothetical protein